MATLLRLEPPTEVDGDRVEYAATLEVGGTSQRLWWRVPAAHREAITTWADPFVLGFVFPMMEAGEDVEIIGGPVSPSLLANLETFMDAWHMWVPERYRRVRISAADEREPEVPTEPDAFIMPFSGGVDACFTAYRHARGLAGRNTKRIGLAATILGFDITRDQPNGRAMYDSLAAGTKAMLDSIGLPHVEIETNFRALPMMRSKPRAWMHAHLTELASGLALFGRRFGSALIANSLPFNELGVLRGSHPTTDALLSSRRFAIVDDGGVVARWEKVEVIARWPESMAHLRVCSGFSNLVGNCGRCEKCIRTALAFKAVGATAAAGLPLTITLADVRDVGLWHPITAGFWQDILEGAAARGRLDEPWVSAVRAVLQRSRRAATSVAVRESFGRIKRRVGRAVGVDFKKHQAVPTSLRASDRW